MSKRVREQLARVRAGEQRQRQTMWTHDALCLRAKRWLSGTKRCNPVFSDCASCSEIPDAIGWSSAGSIVVECKTSASDFYADQFKYRVWRHKKHHWVMSRNRMTVEQAAESEYESYELSRMGDYRFYMSEAGILTPEMIEKHAPDHGLLYVKGSQVKVVRVATKRESVNMRAEVRFLRFAIINNKWELYT